MSSTGIMSTHRNETRALTGIGYTGIMSTHRKVTIFIESITLSSDYLYRVFVTITKNYPQMDYWG